MSSNYTFGTLFHPVLKKLSTIGKKQAIEKVSFLCGFRDGAHYSSAQTSSDYLRKISQIWHLVKSIREIEAEIN